MATPSCDDGEQTATMMNTMIATTVTTTAALRMMAMVSRMTRSRNVPDTLYCYSHVLDTFRTSHIPDTFRQIATQIDRDTFHIRSRQIPDTFQSRSRRIPDTFQTRYGHVPGERWWTNNSNLMRHRAAHMYVPRANPCMFMRGVN